MRIWVIGMGRAGSSAVRQLQKNSAIELITSDPQERPRAVEDGLVDAVDYVERVTPININTLARRIRPDMILITAGAGLQSYSNVTGGHRTRRSTQLRNRRRQRISLPSPFTFKFDITLPVAGGKWRVALHPATCSPATCSPAT